MTRPPAQIDLTDAVEQVSSVVAPPTPFRDDDFAGFGRRVVALLLDTACYLVSLFVFLVLAALVLGGGSISLEGTRFFVVSFGWSLVWETCWIAGPFRGKPGQRMAGFRVVRHDGGRVTLPRAAVRWGVRMLAWPTTGLTLLVSALMIHATGRNQALHDLAAGTVCVRSEAATRIRQPQFAGSIATEPGGVPTTTPPATSSGPFL